MHIKTQDVVVIGISAALYAVFGILTAGWSFLGVGFLPAVVIPAVFAVLFGPWVGGLGAAIGIFIRDMFVHGIPLLSLSAGVPPNFIAFFLVGYIAYRNISLKQALSGVIIAAIAFLAFAVVFLPESIVLTGLSSEAFMLTIGLTIILSLATIAAVAIRWKEWRSYAIGSVVGLALGAVFLSVLVWIVSPYFVNDYFTSGPLAAIYVPSLFIWTFATEIPFVLLVGPPIIKACYRAFPFLRQRRTSQLKGAPLDQTRS
jgi:hypothetical protein